MAWRLLTQPCTLCQGSGRLFYGQDDGKTCPACNGSGNTPSGLFGLLQQILPVVCLAGLALASYLLGWW